MPKRRRKTKPPAKRKRRKLRKPRMLRIREDKLTPMIRQAIRAGCVEAIEHCHSFWSVGDGYKKYIDHQILAQADALKEAMREVLRTERLLFRRKR